MSCRKSPLSILLSNVTYYLIINLRRYDFSPIATQKFSNVIIKNLNMFNFDSLNYLKKEDRHKMVEAQERFHDRYRMLMDVYEVNEK